MELSVQDHGLKLGQTRFLATLLDHGLTHLNLATGGFLFFLIHSID
jgi:hypothetical protein